uniref:Ribosomal protein S8 n=1 Tax=Trachydiscus minutus TaxID=1032745 RepID=A0A140F2N6_9STRA|nr:ribosomal protein S8 [Trachydiscus minutus]AML60670.1 ribosomal protein S8 [Trachydiscus minutus]
MRYSIWSMYSNIKNGLMSGQRSILYPKTFLCSRILKVLYKEGYINGFRTDPLNTKYYEIFLKFHNGRPVISRIQTVSRPGRRIYASIDTLWKLDTSFLTLIVSTSKGIFSDKECRRYSQGGEVLCVIF